ncbi:hypothetical protein EWM64_g9227 [Hericium alpestre]|uniref:RGS domain-containing protein n=1 Tax=Hericium alpestre TaxID=135208 RepID=A0A4Y9ZJL4_9AGAM|nr:hypothetical protein EWM64_g9227 [Hericium alpestre]
MPPSSQAVADSRPKTISLSVLALLSLPYRLCHPPDPTVGKVRSCQVTPLYKVKLEDVINKKHLPPLGLKDFEEWLLYVDGSPENLYFMLWLREYTARYFQWEAGAKSQADLSDSKDQNNYSFSTSHAPDPALSLFYARAKQTFFTPNADYELNVVSDILATFHTSHFASPPYPHPEVFSRVAWEVHAMLQDSLDRFVVAAYQNVGTNRAICGIIGGTTFSLAGSVPPMVVNFVHGHARYLRLAALPGLWLGLTVLLASLHGVCMMVYVFGDFRQLRKFELSRPRISAPKSNLDSQRISRPVYPNQAHSRSITALPTSMPPLPSRSSRVPAPKLDIPAPPPIYNAPVSSSPSSATSYTASLVTPLTYNRSSSSLTSSGTETDALSDKCDPANVISISEAYYDADPAPEGPATRTGPGSALPLALGPAWGGSYKFGNPDPRYHSRECRANKACRVSGTADFIRPYDSVEDFDRARFDPVGRAASAMEEGLSPGLPLGGQGAVSDVFDFDALPMRGEGSAWYGDDESVCICPMTPAIASSVALPSTRPTSSQGNSPSLLSPTYPLVEKEPPRYNAQQPRPIPLEEHPARCSDLSPRAFLARAQYKCKHNVLPLPHASSTPLSTSLTSAVAPSGRDARCRRAEKHEAAVRTRERIAQAVPAFGPLTRVLSPVVSRAQWDIVVRSAMLAGLFSIIIVGTLCAVPVPR